VIQIGIHPAGEKPNNTSYAWPLRCQVRQPSAKSLLDQNWVLALRMKSWFPAIVRPNRHPRLPHSTSRNHLEAGRCGSTNQNLLTKVKTTWSLIDTGRATTLEPWNSHGPLPTLPFRVLHFPQIALPGHTNNMTLNL
jgi:hypothetical protein